MAESKLSFSISKPNPNKRPSSNFNFTQSDPLRSQNHHEFVTEFDPSQTLIDNNQSNHIIIPRLENTWNPYKKMKNIDLPMRGSVSDDPDLRFEIEAPITADASDSSMAYGLNVREGDKEKREMEVKVKSERKIENVILQKFKDDMKNLPDDLGMDEFTDVPVEGFGAALLKGYGWSEGMGIGKNVKEDVKVVQYVRRGDKEGLGFVPEVARIDKKGRKAEVMVAPKGADGRNRHVVGVDEKLVPRELKGVHVGKVVRIVSGRHVGLKGKVLEKSNGENSSSVKIVLKLSNDEKVSVGVEEVAELGTVDDELCVQEMKLKSRGSKDDDRRKVERRESSSHRESEKKSGGRDDRKKDRRGNREEERSLSHTKYSNGSEYRSNEYGSKEIAKSTTITWLRNHIRVRIISKDFKGGKLYLKKGVVVDVVGPNTCDISLDETNQLIQGVDQDILETAIPKRGGPVLVLYGKHKGVYGHLVERNNEKETGVVRDADNLDLLNVQLEQIAEYMGDPSTLGY
ncbi:hypothetical protein ACHQM5_012069 [Ranunculus cassubicifolius]